MLICTHPPPKPDPPAGPHMAWYGDGLLDSEVRWIPSPIPSTARLLWGLALLFCSRSICYCDLRLRAIEIQPMGVNSAGSWESFRLGALKGLGSSVKGREFGGQNPPPFYFCFSGSQSRHLSD